MNCQGNVLSIYPSSQPASQDFFIVKLNWWQFFSGLYFFAFFFFTSPLHTDTRPQSPSSLPPPCHILLTRFHSNSSSLFWPLGKSSPSLGALSRFRRVLIIFIQHFWVFYARRYCSLIKILERVLLLLSSPNISIDMVPFLSLEYSFPSSLPIRTLPLVLTLRGGSWGRQP